MKESDLYGIVLMWVKIGKSQDPNKAKAVGDIHRQKHEQKVQRSCIESCITAMEEK